MRRKRGKKRERERWGRERTYGREPFRAVKNAS